MSNLHDIKKEIKELEAKAAGSGISQEQAVKVTAAVPELNITNDDPELQKYLTDPNSETAKLFPQFCSFTIADAKKAMARDLHQKKLLATVSDEDLPIQMRIEAAVLWRSLRPAGNRWAALSDADLVETLSTHPQLDRLKQLSALVCDSEVPRNTDWRSYLNDMWAMIAEFNTLRQKHPLRDAPVMLALESVASGFIKNASRELRDNFDWRREIFDYVKILQGRG